MNFGKIGKIGAKSTALKVVQGINLKVNLVNETARVLTNLINTLFLMKITFKIFYFFSFDLIFNKLHIIFYNVFNRK